MGLQEGTFGRRLRSSHRPLYFFLAKFLRSVNIQSPSHFPFPIFLQVKKMTKVTIFHSQETSFSQHFFRPWKLRFDVLLKCHFGIPRWNHCLSFTLHLVNMSSRYLIHSSQIITPLSWASLDWFGLSRPNVSSLLLWSMSSFVTFKQDFDPSFTFQRMRVSKREEGGYPAIMFVFWLPIRIGFATKCKSLTNIIHVFFSWPLNRIWMPMTLSKEWELEGGLS